MDWNAVIKALREEAARDIARSRDAILLTGDKVLCMQLAQVALTQNRIASALEIGMLGEKQVAKDQGSNARAQNDVEEPKVGRGRRVNEIPNPKKKERKVHSAFAGNEWRKNKNG